MEKAEADGDICYWLLQEICAIPTIAAALLHLLYRDIVSICQIFLSHVCDWRLIANLLKLLSMQEKKLDQLSTTGNTKGFSWWFFGKLRPVKDISV